jgi:hypothetical protein
MTPYKHAKLNTKIIINKSKLGVKLIYKADLSKFIKIIYNTGTLTLLKFLIYGTGMVMQPLHQWFYHTSTGTLNSGVEKLLEGGWNLGVAMSLRYTFYIESLSSL